MASTRYGRIYHGDHHHNNIKFPSSEAREKFQEEFSTYHAGHEHDGDAPRFELIKAVVLKSYERGPKEADALTLDGYNCHEIKEYHNREYPDTYTHYRVPTCCVSPIIVFEREFIDAGTLERHELSSVFGDMAEDDFENLVQSVKNEGFMDSLIRTHENKILDGWHRYQAALKLNLVRKLMFMNWDEEDEGNAIAFVAARNIERRHLTASQRAQIVVFLNERFGWGGDRSKTPDDALKTKVDLAAEANVGASTIDRAVKVEKLGKSEAVISGEKTASQVIKEETLKSLWEQVSAEMPEWKRRNKEKSKYESDHIGRASKSMLIAALRFHKDSDADGAATVVELKQLLELIKADTLSFIIEVRRVLKESQQPVEPEPEPEPDPEPEPEPTSALWEQVSAEMPKWKERYKETGYKESDLVGEATLSVLLTALRAYREYEDTGEATVEELKEMLGLMKSDSYPFIRRVREALGGCQPSESDTGDETPAETPVETPACDETDSETSAEDTSLADLNLPSLRRYP